MEARKLNISLLVSIFLLSVIVRLDYLTQSMGKHHEFITGHVLTANSIFEQDGLQALHFSPAWTFHNKADRYYAIPDFIHDENNVQYYVSYPAFSFLAAYVFQVPFGGPSVAAIRVFSLLIHLSCALLIFALLNVLFKKKLSDGFYLPSIAGYVLYLFAPGNLWFHGNVYFADILVQLFFIGTMYVFAKFLLEEYSLKKVCYWFFILFFFGVFTEWIMVLLAMVFCAYFLIKSIKNKSFIKPFLVVSSATLLSLTVTFVQYSSIDGVDSFLKEQSAKLKQRTGMVEEAAEYNRSYFQAESFYSIDEHYHTNYGSVRRMVFICAIVLLLLMFSKKIREGFVSRNKHFILLMLMILSAILMHHFLLFNFTSVHDFSTLKSSIFFSLFIAFVFSVFNQWYSKQAYTNYLFVLALLLISFFSVKEYYEVNGKHNKNFDQYNIGKIIKENVSDDELVATLFYVSPEMMFYSKRTVKNYGSADEFAEFARRIKYDKVAFIGKKDDNTYVLSHLKKGVVTGTKDFKVNRSH